MELRDQLDEQLLRIKEMKELQESKGWKSIIVLLQPRRLALRNTILTGEEEGLNGLIECGKNKAALGELEALLHFPDKTIDEAELEKLAIVQTMAAEEEDEDE